MTYPARHVMCLHVRLLTTLPSGCWPCYQLQMYGFAHGSRQRGELLHYSVHGSEPGLEGGKLSQGLGKFFVVVLEGLGERSIFVSYATQL